MSQQTDEFPYRLPKLTPQVYSGGVPEDVGGTPFPDGWEPDDDHDRGVSDEEFASVVFDEAFVRAAVVHEPTAVERLLAAAQARAEASEAEARRRRTAGASATRTIPLDGRRHAVSAMIPTSTTWTTPTSSKAATAPRGRTANRSAGTAPSPGCSPS